MSGPDIYIALSDRLKGIKGVLVLMMALNGWSLMVGVARASLR